MVNQKESINSPFLLKFKNINEIALKVDFLGISTFNISESFCK